MKRLAVMLLLVLLSGTFTALMLAIQPTYANSTVPTTTPMPFGLETAFSLAIGRDSAAYHNLPDTTGYQAGNPVQGYTTTFSAEGVTLSNEAWTWAMRLQGYDAVTPTADANTTRYERGSLTEWYINGPAGLEQGFTLHEARDWGNRVTLELALSGNLRPALVDDRTMMLQTASGITALRYHGLSAYDARNRPLPAWLTLEGGLRIHVDARDAVYPVTIDPWAETQKLTASDAADGDAFGFSVALDGTTALVGAPRADSGGTQGGAAYVFTESGGVWTQQARLTASDAVDGDRFGRAVALDGTTALVGAYGASGGTYRGAAYVFTESGGVWTQQARLTASDAADGDQFGFSVALDGTTALVGAHYEDGAGTARGAAYVFTESGGVWTQQVKLTASDAADGDLFGVAVALDGTTALVGAYWAGLLRGAAYVYDGSGGWASASETKLTASDAANNNDVFGYSVALNGTTVLVGAYGADSGGTQPGAAYVFTESGGVWTQQAKLIASDAANNDAFGFSVALDGTTALVGAPWADSGGTQGGAAYVYDGSGGWASATETRLAASDAADGDVFGWAVVLDGTTALVGAPWADSGGTQGGAVYVFDFVLPDLQASKTNTPPLDPALSKIGALAPGQLGLPGEQIIWTITAAAPSNANLTNVVVSDTFRSELRIDGVTTSAGTYTINGQAVMVTIPLLSAGSSVTIQVTTTVLRNPDEGTFTNTVTLSADGGVSLSAEGTVLGVSNLPSTGYPPGE